MSGLAVNDVSYIRVFGSVCYPLIQPASKRTGAPRIASSVGIMVGYSDESAGLVVWDPIKKNLKVCRDPALSYSMTPPHQ